jgi:hypothetical protein
MLITNKTGLPETIVNAIKNDPYDKGGADYSVTGLLRPALMNKLIDQYEGELTEDASDRIFSLMGQLMHGLFERAGDKTSIIERRFFTEIDGKTISGQTDIITGRTIQDYKFTTIYKLTDLDDFTAQLNMYRYLCFKAGIVVDKLQVVLIFRDWYKTKALLDLSYPQSQVKVVDLDVWSYEETEQFIKDRIAIQSAGADCTDIERWASGGNYAVMRKGKKRAVRLFDDEADAVAMLVNDTDLYLEERTKRYKRCELYCSVAQYCPLYKKGE